MARTKQRARRQARKSPAKSATRSGGAKRKRKTKPGVKALREIRYYQKSTDLLLRKLPFSRLVREICVEIFGNKPIRWSLTAMLAIQEVAEAYLVGVFRDSVYAMVHRDRLTLLPKDMRLVKILRGQGHVAMGALNNLEG